MPSQELSDQPTVATLLNAPDVYLKECASCGGQFPSYRAICSECEDVADEDGYRDGKKVVAAVVAG